MLCTLPVTASDRCYIVLYVFSWLCAHRKSSLDYSTIHVDKFLLGIFTLLPGTLHLSIYRGEPTAKSACYCGLTTDSQLISQLLVQLPLRVLFASIKTVTFLRKNSYYKKKTTKLKERSGLCINLAYIHRHVLQVLQVSFHLLQALVWNVSMMVEWSLEGY